MDYYNKTAAGYHELHHEEQKKKFEIMKQYLDLKKTSRLLDLGCGPGFCDFDCDIYRVDPATQLLKHANGKRIVASAEHLPFPDKFFDAVLSITAIQNFTDIKKSIAEMKRVCHGIFVLSFLKKSARSNTILDLLKSEFEIKEILEEDKDWIVVAR